MTKLLVVSDSHGNTVKLCDIVARETPFDYIIHCGDGMNDLIHASMPAGSITLAVAGNIDAGRGVVGERLIDTVISGRRFLITHGDMFGAHSGLARLEDEARKRNADIVLFGHTHVKHLRLERPSLFNPGPANNGLYGIIEVVNTVDFAHRILPEQ